MSRVIWSREKYTQMESNDSSQLDIAHNSWIVKCGSLWIYLFLEEAVIFIKKYLQNDVPETRQSVRMVIRSLKFQATNTGVGLLFGHLIQYGIKNIPPATLALIAGQTAIFMDPGFMPTPENVCISSQQIYFGRDWLRMLLSAFYHGTDMHLYYNMVSLMYKGSWLEKKFGTPYYVYLVGVFTALINTLYVALGMFLSWLLKDDSYMKSCAVGFSGVLFAMKVLTTHYAPRGPQLLFGVIPVPSKYMCWAELVLIQLMVPNASFVGHLAGILVGVSYTWGPLRVIMELFLEPQGSSVDAPSGTTSPVHNSTTGLDDIVDRPEQPPARLREPSLEFATQPTTHLQSGFFHSGPSLMDLCQSYLPPKPDIGNTLPSTTQTDLQFLCHVIRLARAQGSVSIHSETSTKISKICFQDLSSVWDIEQMLDK